MLSQDFVTAWKFGLIQYSNVPVLRLASFRAKHQRMMLNRTESFKWLCLPFLIFPGRK
jgi:hypothetical protein